MKIPHYIHIKSPPKKRRAKNRCTYTHVSKSKTTREERGVVNLIQVLIF